jgi:glucose-6-phosphate-specific signal transduction histidine kinase
MQGKIDRSAGRVTEVLLRGFWLLLLILHTPALVASWRFGMVQGFNAEVLGGCVLLSLAVAFFVLKLFGLRCLRLRLDRQGWITVCLVVALIHLDCVRPGLRSEVVSKCAIALVTVPAVVAIPRMARAVRTTLQRTSTAHKSHLPGDCPTWLSWSDGFRPRDPVFAFLPVHLRAPPA